MPALSEHGNVHSTAIALLREKGFQVWVEEGGENYWAEKDGWDFMADSPISLLGLVAIFEVRAPQQFRDYWWRLEPNTPTGKLPNAPVPYVPIFRRGK
jgi:hypothetical protein